MHDRINDRYRFVRHQDQSSCWPGPGVFQHRPGHLLLARNTVRSLLRERNRYDARVPDDLMSTIEIAELLGVSRQRVDKLSRSDQFPSPMADLAIGRVWRRQDIEDWTRATGRL